MKLTSNKILSHYGIPNQKWGKRNYQYEDGTYTPEGKERYFGSKIVNKFRQTKEKIFNKYEKLRDNKKFKIAIGLIGLITSGNILVATLRAKNLLDNIRPNKYNHKEYNSN